MKAYEGLTENDWKVIQIALQKLPITGQEAPLMVKLQKKIEMEMDFALNPKDKQSKGDIILKE